MAYSKTVECTSPDDEVLRYRQELCRLDHEISALETWRRECRRVGDAYLVAEIGARIDRLIDQQDDIRRLLCAALAEEAASTPSQIMRGAVARILSIAPTAIQ